MPNRALKVSLICVLFHFRENFPLPPLVSQQQVDVTCVMHMMLALSNTHAKLFRNTKGR